MKRKILAIVLGAAIAGVTICTAYAQDDSDESRHDELLIAAQQTCPVSGKELGSMGQPVKARIGEQTVFLCCKGCLGQSISQDKWAKVITNLAAAQGRCPVMKRPLPKNAKSVVVEGRRVFVCCPPCTKKIQDRPEDYLAVVDALLEEAISQKERDNVGR